MTTRPGYIKDSLGNWIQIGPAVPVGSTVYYQASEPSSPATGDIWIDSDNEVPSIDNSQFLRWKKTVSGGETSLSGNDDNGLSLEYTPAYEQVYLNGVLLVRGSDYTATTGTSITGLTALAASDVVEVFSVVARLVGDVYTQAQTNSLLDAKSNVSSTGLVLLNSTTIGSAVSSITVNNVFSSTYDNYKIIVTGGVGSTAEPIKLTLGSTTTGYYAFWTWGLFNSNTVNGYAAANTSGFQEVGQMDTDSIHLDCDLYAPFLSKTTRVKSFSTKSVTTSYAINTGGFLNNTNSYTGFTLTPNLGTITGGTIKVYGYK